MLRHIVMMKFNEDVAKEEQSKQVKEMLLKLEDSVPSLQRMEVGINVNKTASAFDLVLTADFKDEDGLNAYRVHPDHVEILDVMKTTVDKVTVVDYMM